MAETAPDSNTQIFRYIRLTNLSKELLQKVDEQATGLQIGRTLSYLTDVSQDLIYTYYFVDHTNQHIDQALANELRAIDADPAQELTVAVLDRLAVERSERRFKVVKIQMKDIRKYFQPDVKKEEVAKIIEEALDFYYSHRQLGEKIVIVELTAEEYLMDCVQSWNCKNCHKVQTKSTSLCMDWLF